LHPSQYRSHTIAGGYIHVQEVSVGFYYFTGFITAANVQGGSKSEDTLLNIPE